MAAAQDRPSWFQRFLLPGFAFKGVVIGGGYATGRELAEFFLPHGPMGGLLVIVAAMLVWSGVCVLTFLLARAMHAFDYRSFFINYELNLVAHSPQMNAALAALFEEDLRVSREIVPRRWASRALPHRFAELIGWSARRWL